MKSVAISATLALIALLAPAGGAEADSPVRIMQAWTRATPGQSSVAAVYLKITSAQDDRLVGASTPMAAQATLHLNRISGGTAQMRPVDAIAIMAGKVFTFAPMGYHIMLSGLKEPLRTGEHFPLTLDFVKAGDIVTEVDVKPLRSETPASPADGTKPMPGMAGMPGMGSTP